MFSFALLRSFYYILHLLSPFFGSNFSYAYIFIYKIGSLCYYIRTALFQYISNKYHTYNNRKQTDLSYYDVISLLILAMGIILNTKSGLGVSPIISVAYSVSTIAGVNFGNTTFALYAVFVAVEILLHTAQSRRGCLNAKLSLQIG